VFRVRDTVVSFKLNSEILHSTQLRVLFCKICEKKHAKKGLAKNYIKDSNVRKSFKYLKALAFVPPRNVLNAFNEISAQVTVILNLMLI
jgi:hypothetical protein